MADFRPPYSISNLPPDAIPELACYNSTVDLSDNIWKRGNVIGEAVPLLSILYLLFFDCLCEYLFCNLYLSSLIELDNHCSVSTVYG